MKNAVLIYQEMVCPKSPKKLPVEDVFVYAQLRKRVSAFGEFDTNLDFLDTRIKLLADKSRNKKRIMMSIDRLAKQGYILVEKLDKDNFIIKFTDLDRNKHPYDLIPMPLVNQAQTPEEFVLFCHVVRFQKHMDVCKLSDSWLMSVLTASKNKARDVVNDLVNRGYLVKRSGKYVDEKMQEMNAYFIPHVDVKNLEDVIFEVTPVVDEQELNENESDVQEPHKEKEVPNVSDVTETQEPDKEEENSSNEKLLAYKILERMESSTSVVVPVPEYDMNSENFDLAEIVF